MQPRGSLRLDVGGPDHLAPLLGFLSHQLPEFGRRHRHELAAERAAMVGPPQTEIVGKLNQAVNAVLADPKLQARRSQTPRYPP